MKSSHHLPLKFSSLSEAHRAMGLPQPKHPLVSLINSSKHEGHFLQRPGTHALNFYKISYKPNNPGRLRYGQGYYDFDGGGLLFAAPNQVIGNHNEAGAATGTCSLYTLLVHPDFLLNHPLARTIKQYGFFSYSANEALHLSDEEKSTIISIFQMIEGELDSRIDDHSQNVVIAQLELLLNYANRFYRRQFITRKVADNEVLHKFEELLDRYFQNESSNHGTPSVHSLAEQLNMSASYLSDMLRVVTGKSAQQHIHDKLIDKAKEMLTTTNLSVSEVAYALGFEYSQSFSKLFKNKTKVSPLEFKQSFN